MKNIQSTANRPQQAPLPSGKFLKYSSLLLLGWTVLVIAFLFQFSRLVLPH